MHIEVGEQQQQRDHVVEKCLAEKSGIWSMSFNTIVSLNHIQTKLYHLYLCKILSPEEVFSS